MVGKSDRLSSLSMGPIQRTPGNFIYISILLQIKLKLYSQIFTFLGIHLINLRIFSHLDSLGHDDPLKTVKQKMYCQRATFFFFLSLTEHIAYLLYNRNFYDVKKRVNH